MKIVSIVGARPQFIKMGALHQEIKKHKEIESVIIHTGQHYDTNMSDVFFEEMEIETPRYNLNINQIDRVELIERMVEGIKEILKVEKPDYIVVFGDTNSTLAGALAGKEVGIPTAHIEAGLRSFNMSMPEEINRIETDKICQLLFVPTMKAIENLKTENLFAEETSFLCGDIMLNAFNYYSQKALALKKSIPNLPSKFVLCSLHREGLLENREMLAEVIEALNEINEMVPIIFTAHPRTFRVLQNLAIPITFRIVEAQSYFSMLQLLNKCNMVITDSGGLQKEAYFAKRPCITVREDTEWVELVEAGVNLLSGLTKDGLLDTFKKASDGSFHFSKDFYGKGNCAELIIDKLLQSK